MQNYQHTDPKATNTMSISDLVTPETHGLASSGTGSRRGRKSIQKENGAVEVGENSEPVKRKRGRPKLSEETTDGVRKKFEKKQYLDTPQLRQKLSALEQFIDQYDRDNKSGGRPRVHPLRDTLTRKKIATFPVELQPKFQEYVMLKKILPPTKPLGRPRKSASPQKQQQQQHEQQQSSHSPPSAAAAALQTSMQQHFYARSPQEYLLNGNSTPQSLPNEYPGDRADANSSRGRSGNHNRITTMFFAVRGHFPGETVQASQATVVPKTPTHQISSRHGSGHVL